MRTPEEAYVQESKSDIGLHLPRLRHEARGVVVEIGTRAGASTSALILGVREKGGHVYSIDINPACGTDNFYPIPEWTFICGHSTRDRDRILEQIPSCIDVLFHDAEHDYESVLADLNLYGPMVRPGGVILLHDTENHQAGVTQAMMEYCRRRSLRMSIDSGSYGLGIIQC